MEQDSEWNATCTMYIHFVDFEKAFDLVAREVWNIPKKLTKMVNALYDVLVLCD